METAMSLNGSSSTLTTADEQARMLDADSVALLLSVRRKRVYELVGHLAVKFGRRTSRWRRQDIEQWIEDRNNRSARTPTGGISQ